jgi:hypothetical protein
MTRVPRSDAIALAKACGAAQRVYLPTVALVHLTDQLPGEIRRTGIAVIEQLDLLRFFLREAQLKRVIDPPPAPKPRKRRKRVAERS